MENTYAAKAIIEKHVKEMLEDLGTSDSPVGWIGDNAATLITDVVFATMSYGIDVEEYMKAQNMVKA